MNGINKIRHRNVRRNTIENVDLFISIGKLVAKAEPKPKCVVNSFIIVPTRERKWIDIDPQQFDRSCSEVSQLMTRTLRHETSVPREEDGAVRTNLLVLYVGRSKLGRILWHKEEEGRKGFNTA